MVAILVPAFLLIAAGGAGAQEDSVTVRAGAHYAAGSARRAIFGSEYRDLWTAPIRVPVLRPDTFAGGLTLLQRGEGMQTASLRFAAGDGREFVFRSVDKDQSGGLPEDVRGTLIARVAQDQVSSKHPGAALVVAPLLEAAGVLHPRPRLAVMADGPFLGEFRQEFAGMLGMIEERPEDGSDSGIFGSFSRVIGTERLLERFEESSIDRPDAPAYLRARLMDILVGDWDRHADQWRWAQDDRDGIRYWLPVPRDRDNAFSHVDGLIATVAGVLRPNVLEFGPELDVYPLTYNAASLDRRILGELSADEWDGVVNDLLPRLSDRVIADAVARLPAPYLELSGERLEINLRARRDRLPAAAREFYLQLASEVDIFGTDESDEAVVEDVGEGVRVRLHAIDEDRVYFDRTFEPSETREVRLFLHGAPDRAVVRGPGNSPILVRLLGGGNDDVLADSTAPGRRGKVVFHDDRGENIFLTSSSTVVDESTYAAPPVATVADNNPPPPRDWGTERSLFSPVAAWYSGIGAVVGGGPEWTRFGFRRAPFATRFALTFTAAPLHGRFGAEIGRRVVRTGGGGETRLTARATQLVLNHYYGISNGLPAGADRDLARVWSTDFRVEGAVIEFPGAGFRFEIGPSLSYTLPAAREGGPAELEGRPGSEPFGLAGMRLDLSHDGRASGSYDAGGIRLLGGGAAYPLVRGGGAGAFARGYLGAAAYLPLPVLPLDPVLAVRVGGERVWGEGAPLQHLAFLGGGSTLRGYDHQRFSGHLSTYGGAELRSRLGRANLLLLRGDLGTVLLADMGRVQVRGEPATPWQHGVGGGLWFGTLGETLTAHLLLVHGEKLTASAGFGLPF